MKYIIMLELSLMVLFDGGQWLEGAEEESMKIVIVLTSMGFGYIFFFFLEN